MPGKPAVATKVPSSLGQKRKAETEQSSPVKFKRTSNTTISPTKEKAPKPGPLKRAGPKPAEVPAKTPPKGSFADIMAKAKAVQENAPKNFGVIKNGAFERTKLDFPKKGKGKGAVAHNRTVAATAKKQRIADSTVLRRKQIAESNVAEYKGTAKPRPESSTYRGTAGRPATRAPVNRQVSARETFSGYEDSYDDNYDSEFSSDMEAGFDDVAEEEGAALKSARKEDEEELRQEVAAKKAKEERRKRLAALVARKR
ncbi:hypothetical protein N7495_000187 [Penicillium taxi]|uniref:uncharacterized protein n=1 Tax=Penicillium taxi TaxID=168475 RepID=UPI0025455FF8|nr:uncharacterized protein N7495_000187 [Penicillium taxi]KAJ5907505.1 hypothetical protein N7495_000187 [Penicillium taxi]